MTADDLDRSIALNQIALEEEQELAATFPAKLQRLYNAERNVLNVMYDCESAVTGIRLYDVGVAWQGEHREAWEADKSSAADQAQAYCDAVAEIDRAINRKIDELYREQGECLRQIDILNASIYSFKIARRNVPK